VQCVDIASFLEQSTSVLSEETRSESEGSSLEQTTRKRKMRNGQTAQQTAVMTPPHLNGTAQFISGGYVTTGYLPTRQSWTQFQPSSQHPARSAGRPLSLPPPPPSSRRDNQRPCNGGPAKNTSLPHLRAANHRSTTPSVSQRSAEIFSRRERSGICCESEKSFSRRKIDSE